MFICIFACIVVTLAEGGNVTTEAENRAAYLEFKQVHNVYVSVLGEILSSRPNSFGKQLESTPEQVAKINVLYREYKNTFNKFERERLPMSQRVRRLSSYLNDIERRTGDILLPHQMKQIKQKIVRTRAASDHNFGPMGYVLGLRELELTSLEQRELKTLIEIKLKEFQKEELELRQKHEKDMLNAIPADTRHQVKDDLGQLIDMVRFWERR